MTIKGDKYSIKRRKNKGKRAKGKAKSQCFDFTLRKYGSVGSAGLLNFTQHSNSIFHCKIRTTKDNLDTFILCYPTGTSTKNGGLAYDFMRSWHNWSGQLESFIETFLSSFPLLPCVIMPERQSRTGALVPFRPLALGLSTPCQLQHYEPVRHMIIIYTLGVDAAIQIGFDTNHQTDLKNNMKSKLT